jgi:predicted ABC-type ATPase
MLRRIDELVEGGADFVVETTLASLTYAQKIPAWRKLGYLERDEFSLNRFGIPKSAGF